MSDKERKKHPPFKHGSRQHVIWWTDKGRHCSEPDCEINKTPQKKWPERIGVFND